MKDDRRTANIDIDILQLIFERVSKSLNSPFETKRGILFGDEAQTNHLISFVFFFFLE